MQNLCADFQPQNRLASLPRVPHRLPKPKRKPVTLIVGIICKDGIVMAGDSQTTWGTGKSYSANKMKELESVEKRVLIAESGAEITSSKAVEYLDLLLRENGVHTNVPELAAKAVRQVRTDLRKQQFDCTAEELQNYIYREELDCELMMAHYENGHPKIDTIRLSAGIPKRAKSFFETVGSGSDLANYVLTDLCNPNMETDMASVFAVQAVEIAKRHDPYCGGPVKLGVMPHPIPGLDDGLMWRYSPLILGEHRVAQIIQMVEDLERINKENREYILKEQLKIKASETRNLFLKAAEEAHDNAAIAVQAVKMSLQNPTEDS
jgi:20S proteasome alpha/beta subunit